MRTEYLRGRGATVAGLVVSGALLAGLYRSVDVRLIGESLWRTDKAWLVISIGMILPITVLRAIRFFWVAPVGALPGIGEALRLTLVASALNVVVPAKGGDLIKSYFVAKRSETSTSVAIAIIVYERLCDLFGLVTWCLVGWLVARPQIQHVPPLFWALLAALGGGCGVLISSERAAALSRTVVTRAFPQKKLQPLRNLADGWPDLLRLLRGRRRLIVSFSVLMWFVHLLQMWMFTLALSAHIPLTVCANLSAVALLAGLLPLTFAGLGTRDVALVLLLSPYMAPASAAAMGVLTSTRNLLPSLAGLPMMWPYLSSVMGEARRWRADTEQIG